MARSKVETSAYTAAADERPGLWREIFGILIALTALLIFLALLSDHYGARWIGPIGDRLAGSLDYILGSYVAFALPFMLAVTAFHAMRGSPFSSRRHSWLRGLGGLLLLISTCSILTLSTPLSHFPRVSKSTLVKKTQFNRTSSVEAGPIYQSRISVGAQGATRAFERGGLVGNMMVDACGLNIGQQIGLVGAFVVFGALVLIGLVLFTETMLRDLARLVWGNTRRVVSTGAGWSDKLPRPARLFSPRMILGTLWQPFAAMGDLHPIEFVAERLRGLILRRRSTRLSAHPASPAAGRVVRTGNVFAQSGLHEMHPSAELEYDEQSEDFNDYRDDAYSQDKDSATYEDEAAAYAPAAQGLLEETDRPVRSRASGVFSRPQSPPRPEPIVPQILDFDTPADRIEHPEPPATRPRTRRDARERAATGGQSEMILFPAEFILPPLSLLADPPTTMYEMSDEEKDRLSRRIEQTLAQFKVEVEVFEVIQGPVITRFALKVAPGIRVNKIQALESELAMALKAQHVRILAPIPGQSAVGIEVPNKRSNPVVLRDLIDSDAFHNHKSPLAFALGKNIAGEAVVCDLAQMPHLLIAGATGSGKSVCLNAIIASLLYRNKPDRVKFIMVDPKRVELSIYQAIPHLIAPVVSETKKAAAALAWCVEQMESRYKILAEIGVRNLDSYNALLNEKTPNKKLMGRDLKFLPHIVIIIDELADLMMVARNEVEEYIIRLAQMARAVGMHLVLATQRPSVNVITGIIKANFPSRIAFQVSSKVDSRTILDQNGAEALLGRGDMLYSPGGAKPFRIQGAYVGDAEVERLADYIRDQEKVRYEKEDFEMKPTPAERAKAQLQLDGQENGTGEDEYFEGTPSGANTINMGSPGGLAVQGRAGSAPLTPGDIETLSDKDLYNMALKLILESRKASVSYIQRRMKIGYARAGRIMDMMEEEGIVGPYQGSKPRDLLVDPAEYMAEHGGDK